MKTTLVVLVLAASAIPPGAFAAHRFDRCDVGSGYDLQVNPEVVRFRRGDGTPHEVEMQHGELRIDGRNVELSRADRERIAEYEATVRRLIPQVKAIARDATDIAFTAVGEVAEALAGRDAALHGRIARLRGDVRAQIDASFEQRPWRDRDFEALVESTVQELVPAIAANVASVAVKAALAGDEAAARDIERRADRLESEIKARVEAHARQIEARAEALCPIVAQLDTLEQRLDYRLDDGRPLDLVQVRD